MVSFPPNVFLFTGRFFPENAFRPLRTPPTGVQSSFVTPSRHTMKGTLNAEQQPTAQTRSRNAFSFFQPAAGADFLAFLGINDA